MNPIVDSAADVILVGDPRRAFNLARDLTVEPEMSHLARGLWGYRGRTAEGRELSVQSTGPGGPAAVPVIGDLANQGARRILRLGTCLGTDPVLDAGSVIVVERAFAADGAGRRLLPDEDFARPDPGLLKALADLGQVATISSHDLVERHEPAKGRAGVPADTVARDLQTAAVLAFCRQLGLPAAALLVVAEDNSGLRLDEHRLTGIFRDIGLAALDRLP